MRFRVAALLFWLGPSLGLSVGIASEADNIIFAEKNFLDSPDVVAISGTLTGGGLRYPNNTVAIRCVKSRDLCFVSGIRQIGPDRAGRLDFPYTFNIKRWTDSEVVASDDATLGCLKSTVTMMRKKQTAVWVDEPINASAAECAIGEPKLRRMTIEDSPGWRRLFAK